MSIPGLWRSLGGWFGAVAVTVVAALGADNV
jgi:hypothetical protein